MALVAYTDPQGVFGRHEETVQRHLAYLKNLHWRPLNPPQEEIDLKHPTTLDTTIRTIAQLNLHLSPEGSEKPKQHQIPGLNNTPLVQILVIQTTSLEIYREKLRQIGKNWFANNVNVRDHTGFVVVHAVSSADSPKMAKAIWTRLNNEFGATNCVQLDVSVKEQSPDWLHLQHTVAAQLTSAFGLRIAQLQLEIRKLRATQDIPGWNFGAFLAVHESLASAYASLSLTDDAYRVYQYMEKVVRDRPRDSWGAEPHLANPAGIGHLMTHIESLRYRDFVVDLVLSQKSSYFDIQQALLAKQVDLLIRMNESQSSDSLANTYVRESIQLVVSRLPLLQELLEPSVGRRRALTWLLTSLRQFFGRVTEVRSPQIASGKAELLLIERDYLQGLSALNGWCIPGVFNEISLESDSTNGSAHETISNGNSTNGISNGTSSADSDAIAGIESAEDYEQTFLRLSNAAIQYYASAGMHRAELKLTAQLLVIKYHQEKYEECWHLYTKHPQLLADHTQRFTAMAETILACAQKLGKYEECVRLSWQVLDLPTAPLKLVQTAVSEIENSPAGKGVHEKPLDKWFIPKLVPYLRADEEGYYLELSLVARRPNFPFVKFSKVALHAKFVDPILGSTQEIILNAKAGDIGNRMKLYTSHFTEGLLEINSLTVWHQTSTQFIHVFEDTIVAMRPLSSFFTATVELSKSHNMQKRDIELKLNCTVPVKHAKVHFRPVDPQLQLLLEKMRGADPQSLSNFTEAVISVPVLIDSEFPVLRLQVSIDFDCGNGPVKYVFYEQLNFALAVSVDFQESFRQRPRILTQFLVKPFNMVPIVFSNAELKESKMYSVQKLKSAHYDRQMTAYYNAPVSYVFSIQKWDLPRADQSGAMQFRLRYRPVSWECRHILYERCLALMDETIAGYKCVLKGVVESIEQFIDLAEYICSHIVRLTDKSAVRNIVAECFEYMDPAHASQVADAVIAAADESAFPAFDFSSLDSIMSLDVPDPDAEIVHYLSLQIDDNSSQNCRPDQYAVGEAISATLRIDSFTFYSQEMLSTRKFEYELDRLSEGWSYSGRVKGCFSGDTGLREKLCLIPNRSGELFLPNVIVKPVYDSDTSHVRADSSFGSEVVEEEQVVVSEHANKRLLIVPDSNMLAITF